jgi:hypothetical protein
VKLKIEALKETRKFYNWKLKDKGLTKKQRDSFLLALKNIEGIIQEKEKAGEKRKHKRFIAYDNKTVFHNNRSYRGY